MEEKTTWSYLLKSFKKIFYKKKMTNSLGHYYKKVFIIVYASIVNFLIASILCQIVEANLLYSYDDTVSKYNNLFRLCVNVSIIAVFAYLLRQMSEILPLPFKSKEFDPERVKEVKGSVLTAFTLFLFLGDNIKQFKLH